MMALLIFLAILPQYSLIWHPVPRATSYVLERQATLDPNVWRNDTLCSEAYACSLRMYTPECTRMVIKSAALDSISRCYEGVVGYMNIRFVPWRVGMKADSVFIETVPVQVKVRAVNAYGSTLSEDAWTMLTLDWSAGNTNYSTFDGNGAMGCTSVKVMLPTQHWTLTYSYQGAIPIYVKATCDFDYNHDDKVNLIDFVLFMPDYIASGRSLSLLGSFSMCYQLGTKEWR